MLTRAFPLGLAILFASGSTPARAQRAIYLVRHAEKASNDPSARLSANGEAQASKLACLLIDAGITSIYTTNIDRTKQKS